jgi:uncharacterized protein YigE (DUF2233 family)
MRVLALLVLLAAHAMAADRCTDRSFDNQRFVVCTVDLRKDKLALFDVDDGGAAYGSFARVLATHPGLSWAMNAGMYDDKLRPIGLYVEDGKALHAVSTKDGPGNFAMKPNGVFWAKGDRVGVTETSAYTASDPHPDWATQSGPMLVVNGAFHPQISPTGTSRKRRNGVGALDDHRAVFVISEAPVTFFELASLFRDALGCKNALFLDGSISSLFDPEHARTDAIFPLGPIVGVVH